MITNDRHTLERLAYEAWLRRGSPIGSPEVDWDEACKVASSSEADQEIPAAAPGGRPTDLGAEPIPESSHDAPKKPKTLTTSKDLR